MKAGNYAGLAQSGSKEECRELRSAGKSAAVSRRWKNHESTQGQYTSPSRFRRWEGVRRVIVAGEGGFATGGSRFEIIQGTKRSGEIKELWVYGDIHMEDRGFIHRLGFFSAELKRKKTFSGEP